MNIPVDVTPSVVIVFLSSSAFNSVVCLELNELKLIVGITGLLLLLLFSTVVVDGDDVVLLEPNLKTPTEAPELTKGGKALNFELES